MTPSLLQHVRHSEGTYRDEIIAKILFMCSKEKFGLMTDFAWYASVLLDLAVMQGKKLEGRRRVRWVTAWRPHSMVR